MRRLTVSLAAAGMALLLSAGLAFAATYECVSGRACVGTEEADTLDGSGGFDPYMDGRQGDDRLFANGGGYAFMQGDAFDAPENDTTTDGDDLLKGGPGYDEMAGFGGNDTFLGGARGDFVFAEETSANRGKDTVSGGRGNDYVEAKDGVRDAIDCGGGARDVAFFDKGGVDVVENCEYRNRWPDPEEVSRAATSTVPEKVGAEKVDALRARR